MYDYLYLLFGGRRLYYPWVCVSVCACLEGSVWRLLYVLFAYEIRYSKAARRWRRWRRWRRLRLLSQLPCHLARVMHRYISRVEIFSIQFYSLFMRLPDVFMHFSALWPRREGAVAARRKGLPHDSSRHDLGKVFRRLFGGIFILYKS